MPEWRNWYTRTTQNRVSQGMRVRLPPPAPYKKEVPAECGDLFVFLIELAESKPQPQLFRRVCA